jgi:transmembrane sensor
MNSFLNWLHKYLNKDHGFKKKNHAQQMQKIWEESSKLNMPEALPSQIEWLKLERAIAITENKESLRNRIKIDFSLFVKRQFIYAYVVIFFIALSLFIFNSLNIDTYQTSKGERLTINLPDNSKIILNCGSCLKYNRSFIKSIRQVQLEGEAYFKVQKGNSPFIVQTAIANVQVLGTEFNVNNRYNRLQVAVNEGVVEVSSKVGEKDSTVIIKKGQFNICMAGEYPRKSQNIKFKQYPCWLHGHLTFDQSTFRYVCEEIERQFNVSIKITDDQLNNTFVSGLFKTTNLDSLMSSICVLVQKEYKTEDGTFIIY